MNLLKLKAFHFLVFVLFLLPKLQFFAQSLKLSEVMFRPSGTNNEFIEIFNNSKTETIDLTDYKILYHTSSKSDVFQSKSSNYILLPKQYAIVLEGDYDFENGTYKNIIPDSSLVFVLSDNAFGRSGMANSSNRTVYLLNAENDTLDSYTYTANNPEGVSDERISFDENIWANSISINGTPGKRNSVAQRNNDLSIVYFYSFKKNITVGDSVKLGIKIKNLGTSAALEFGLQVFNDKNLDEIPQENELVYSQNFSSLNSNDSLSVIVNINSIALGENNFIAKLNYSPDEQPNNNRKLLSISGQAPNELRNKLLINEIMYSPVSPEPEWIELFNNSNKNIYITKLNIADSKDTSEIIISTGIIKSKDYLVISKDTSFLRIYNNVTNLTIANFPTLNNGNDKVIILDSLNRVIDSVSYNSTMGGSNGNSLERISPDISSDKITNWKESLAKATPGQINSVTQKDYDIKLDSIFTNPEFPVINDVVRFSVHVKNIGKYKINFNIELFSDYNSDSLADNLIEISPLLELNKNDSLLYNFSFLDTVSIKKQNYVFRIKQTDDDTTNNIKYFSLLPAYPPKSIVINEIMFLPENGEPEWIELFNNSDYNIDISNWQVGDVYTKPIFKNIAEHKYIFPAKSFLIISKSNGIYNYHRKILSPVVELKFANLNNDIDGVVLKDNRNITIDSLLYNSDFNHKKGYSIERVDTKISSTNPNNWKVSLDIENSTPGRINSVSPKKYDLVEKELKTIPDNPVTSSNIKIKTKIFNRGNFDAENFSLDFYYNSTSEKINLENRTNLSLSAGDSLTIISNNEIKIKDTLTISADITFPKDEDMLNNFLETKIVAGFNKDAVLINEIMFNPKNGDPEWIEFINNTDSTININNWNIGNLHNKNLISTDKILINSKDYFIVSNFFHKNIFPDGIKVIQTNLPNYSKTKDAVILYDYRNAVIDSMVYNFTTSIPKGISLERISLLKSSTAINNWMFSLSASGSTPGESNSITDLPVNIFGDIIINEIMYNPDTSNCEFIELFNNSSKAIEIGGWNIVDEDGNNFITSTISKILQPADYFVLSADSSILKNYKQLNTFKNISIKNKSSLNLSNEGELIFLKDFRGKIIDSIGYSSKWQNSSLTETKNISLELINPQLNRNTGKNWSSSVNKNGATPGKKNSIFVEKLVNESKIFISPNPFSPDNDGFEDFTFISYKLTQPTAQIRVKIYDSKGRLVRILRNNTPTGAEGTITFNGLDENAHPLKMGIYIVLLEAVNPSNTVIETIKAAMVIARKF